MDLTLLIVIVCVVVAVALVVVFVVFGRSEANFTFDIGGASPRASGGSDSSTEKTLSSTVPQYIAKRFGNIGLFRAAPATVARKGPDPFLATRLGWWGGEARWHTIRDARTTCA